jgi:4-alpha-glucanotransferase
MAQVERVSGVLLHVTSLPSYGGIGDFGPAAYAFVDFLSEARQRLWQVLPLTPVGYGNSPYSSLSAFAGNPLMISLEKLVEAGWLSPDRIAGLPGHNGPCDFSRAFAEKIPLIEEAARNFLDHAGEEDRNRFQRFAQDNSYWLTDWALFSVLRRRHNYAGWWEWPHDLAFHKSDAISAFMNEAGRELATEQAVQFFFTEQWNSLREYCHGKGIQVMGDVAIFVSYDSCDVWTHPEIFELDENRKPVRVSGVPPDYFSETGQLWGNPLYRWQLLKDHDFDWWVSRMRRALCLHDSIRLDHFRGFEAFWSVDASETTALNGQWVKGPGRDLFLRLKKTFGNLPFIAEDLGLITTEVDDLRTAFDMPGMRILQFGFAERGEHLYLPHRYVPNTVVYTGTHDNNTTLGWWREDATPVEREHVQIYLHRFREELEVPWALMRSAASSVAITCLFPMQDVLCLGSEARMNKPAAAHGNWSWRFSMDDLKPVVARKLRDITEMTDRDGRQKKIEGEGAGGPSDQSHLRVLEGSNR